MPFSLFPNSLMHYPKTKKPWMIECISVVCLIVRSHSTALVNIHFLLDNCYMQQIILYFNKRAKQYVFSLERNAPGPISFSLRTCVGKYKHWHSNPTPAPVSISVVMHSRNPAPMRPVEFVRSPSRLIGTNRLRICQWQDSGALSSGGRMAIVAECRASIRCILNDPLRRCRSDSRGKPMRRRQPRRSGRGVH